MPLGSWMPTTSPGRTPCSAINQPASASRVRRPLGERQSAAPSWTTASWSPWRLDDGVEQVERRGEVADDRPPSITGSIRT